MGGKSLEVKDQINKFVRCEGCELKRQAIGDLTEGDIRNMSPGEKVFLVTCSYPESLNIGLIMMGVKTVFWGIFGTENQMKFRRTQDQFEAPGVPVKVKGWCPEKVSQMVDGWFKNRIPKNPTGLDR